MDSVLIARGQMIAGVDAVQLRELLRRLGDAVFTARGFAEVADDGANGSDIVFGALEQEGLIEPAVDYESGPCIHGHDEDFDGSELWRTTVPGNALAKARIGKPMRREEAERRLASVIARAGEVNRDPDQLFYIETIELFGSLTDPAAQYVGDVDLRVVICRRLHGQSLVRELNRRRRGNLLDAMTTAIRQLRRDLTDGSPKIDLQLDEITSRPLPDGTQAELVYSRAQVWPAADGDGDS